MTGDVRDQLAAHRLTTPRQCLCGARQDGEWSDTWHADHLLPVVEAVAVQRAADELELAAVLTVPDEDTSEDVRDALLRRADALRSRGQP